MNRFCYKHTCIHVFAIACYVDEAITLFYMSLRLPRYGASSRGLLQHIYHIELEPFLLLVSVDTMQYALGV